MAISINDFQRISNGTFNAGDITLTSSGKLDKVNNHVGILKSFNKTSIDTQTTLRVKNEFVNALRQSGVGEAELAGVRKELGLGDADGKGLSLKDLKPLTRAQTREILDRFAKTINDKAGSNIIQNRWAGNEARQTSNVELGRTIAAATEERLAGINKGIGMKLFSGSLGPLPSNIKSELKALNLSAEAVKNFAKLTGFMLQKTSADAGDIAVEALKKTLLAEFGAKLQEGEARNMLKTIAKATTGSLSEVGRRLKDAADSIERGEKNDIEITEKFTSHDLHPLEIRKVEVVNSINTQLKAIGNPSLTGEEIDEIFDFMSKWGDIKNGECPNLEATINQSTVDYIKESMDGKGVLNYNEEGFCNQFMGDTHRGTCRIGDQTTDANDVLKLGVEASDKKTCDAMKKMFPDATDRKMITSLMNQSAISCFFHLLAGSPGDRAKDDAPPLYMLDPAGSKVATCGKLDLDASYTKPILVSQPKGANAELNYSVDFDPKTNTATVRAGTNYCIAPTQKIPGIADIDFANGEASFGYVHCECTFTVTGIGMGNPQLVDTKISQTFNMNPD